MKDNTDHICPYCDKKVKGVDKLGSIKAVKKHIKKFHPERKE